jgi:hypothetical protein
LIGDADGYAAVQLTNGQYLTDAAGVDLRTGRIAWRIEGTGGHDRFAMITGTKRLAHYAHAGSLRLVDITTGRADVTVPVPPPREDDVPELYATAGEVVLTSDAGSTVYAADDLSERWSREELVRPVRPGLLYVGGNDHGNAVDAAGHTRWRAASDVFLGADGGGWGFTSKYQDSGGVRIDYLDLATGRRLAEDDHVAANRERGGVLQVDSLDNDGGATFWYLALPSGQRADLGTVDDVLAGTCAFGPAYIACLDARGRLGTWRYR